MRGAEAEGEGMELERSGEMLGEINPVVAAGVDVKFVDDAARVEGFMKRLRAGLKSIFIL